MNFTDRTKTRAFIEGRLVVPGGPFAAADIPGTGTLNVGGIPIATWNPSTLVGSTYEIAEKLVADGASHLPFFNADTNFLNIIYRDGKRFSLMVPTF